MAFTKLKRSWRRSRSRTGSRSREQGTTAKFGFPATTLLCRPASLAAKMRLMLFKPGFAIPTPWAYGKWKESKELPGVDYSPQEFNGVQFVNDLERPVFEKFVLLAHLKTWLRQQPEVAVALMS